MRRFGVLAIGVLGTLACERVCGDMAPLPAAAGVGSPTVTGGGGAGGSGAGGSIGGRGGATGGGRAGGGSGGAGSGGAAAQCTPFPAPDDSGIGVIIDFESGAGGAGGDGSTMPDFGQMVPYGSPNEATVSGSPPSVVYRWAADVPASSTDEGFGFRFDACMDASAYQGVEFRIVESDGEPFEFLVLTRTNSSPGSYSVSIPPSLPDAVRLPFSMLMRDGQSALENGAEILELRWRFNPSTQRPTRSIIIDDVTFYGGVPP